MKKIKLTLVTLVILAVFSQTASASEVPVESTPCNATKEGIAVTESLIGEVITEVKNGLGYGEANGKAQAIVWKAVVENKTDGIGYGELMSIARNAIFLCRDMYLRPELYEDKRAAVSCMIGDLITEVQNGKNYYEALDEAYTRIYQSMDVTYSNNNDKVVDNIYMDNPPADFVMFTLARKLLLEAVPKTE